MTKGHFEAKKHAYRQTQDGVVVSFVIHPSDVPADLATAPLGTVYMIGFAAVGEPGGEAPTREDGGTERPLTQASAVRNSSPTKPKGRWDQLRPSARAALLVKDDAFLEFAQQHRSFDNNGCTNADEWLKAMCRVHSKREFDTNTDAALFMDELTGKFRAWQQAKGHGVAA